MTRAADAVAGKFTAVFTRGSDAKAFFERLAGDPAGFRVAPDSLRLNRKGGREVSWQAAPDAFGGEGIVRYWDSMAETVGYYGSTFGEPPFGRGRRTAYLNGQPGTACM